MKRLIYRINYFSTPVVKEQTGHYLMLESIRNRVWNPVFTVGAIAFFLSMTLRGFFNQGYASITLGISTFVLFAGVWKLSATAYVVFDRQESKAYFVYKHLGYLQKVYVHPLTSFEQVELSPGRRGVWKLQLAKDNGSTVAVAGRSDRELLQQTAAAVGAFLQVPVRER